MKHFTLKKSIGKVIFCASLLLALKANAQNALTFNSSQNDVVTIPYTYSVGTGEFTLEAYVKLSSTQTSGVSPTIFSCRSALNNGFCFYVNSNGRGLTFRNQNTSFSSGLLFKSLFDDKCHHLVVTRRSTSLRFYIDGTVINSIPISSGTINLIGGSSSLLIGNDYSSQPLNGTISYVRFWNTERSSALIANNITTDYMDGNTANMLGYWDMSHNISSQAVYDVSDGVNHGVLGSSASVETSDPATDIKCMTVSQNTGLYFDGVDDRVIVPNHAAFNFGTGDFTVAVWLKPDATQTATFPTLVSHRNTADGFRFAATPSGDYLRLDFGTATTIQSNPFGSINGSCNFVAFTRNAGTINLYKYNGISTDNIGTGTYAGTVDASEVFHFGYDAIDNQSIKGLIQEVLIWNVAKSQADLSDPHDSLGNLYDNIIGHWRMTEKTGEKVIDKAGTIDGSLGTDPIQYDAQNPFRRTTSCYGNDRIGALNETELTNSPQPIGLYPNPVSDKIHSELGAFSSSKISWQIVNAAGQLMDEGSTASQSLDVSTAHYPNGLYLLRVKSDGNMQYKKFHVLH